MEMTDCGGTFNTRGMHILHSSLRLSACLDMPTTSARRYAEPLAVVFIAGPGIVSNAVSSPEPGTKGLTFESREV